MDLSFDAINGAKQEMSSMGYAKIHDEADHKLSRLMDKSQSSSMREQLASLKEDRIMARSIIYGNLHAKVDAVKKIGMNVAVNIGEGFVLTLGGKVGDLVLSCSKSNN